MRKQREDKVDADRRKNSYNMIPVHALRLMELLPRCKCEVCQKELKKLEEKYGIK